MEKLRRFREQKGYSIRRPAKKAGVRWTTVWKAETGRRARTMATPKELAKALGLKAADRLCGGLKTIYHLRTHDMASMASPAGSILLKFWRIAAGSPGP